MFGLIVVGLLMLASRSAFLQVVHKDYLKQQGNARYLRDVRIASARGMITDRNGEVMAVSAPVDSITANPGEFCRQSNDVNADKYGEKIAQLSKLISLSEKKIKRACEVYAKREFMYLKRHQPPAVAAQVLALEIPGVSIAREYKRYYPSGAIAGHVLGFTNVDDHGQEGVELAFNKRLTGKAGLRRVINDRMERTIEHVALIEKVEDGKDLALSIDSRMQYLVFRYLKAAVEKNKAKGGTAVVLNAKTGEVLAMANEPSFNPNNRKDFKSSHFRNRAITDVLEPGSSIKPLTIAMALESGKYRPDMTVQTEPGWFRIGKHTIKDIHNYGLLTVNKVLAKSSNVGTAKIAMKLPARSLYDTLKSFGFGESTNMELKGEVSGQLYERKTWPLIEHATLSFGYGVSVTPIQLARAYTVFANEGQLLPVTLRKRNGAQMDGTRVLDRTTALNISYMLHEATTSEGTATQAQVPHYTVAGKTGTVKKIAASGKGYAEGRYQSVFVGFAPAMEPRFVMVVIVDEPNAGEYSGGQVAAPVFSRVMAGALRLYNVSPDAHESVNLASAPELNTVSVNEGA